MTNMVAASFLGFFSWIWPVRDYCTELWNCMAVMYSNNSKKEPIFSGQMTWKIGPYKLESVDKTLFFFLIFFIF